MNDIIYTGQVADISPLIGEIGWLPDTLMILERMPVQWMEPEERENGICFEVFDIGKDFNSWHRGRIFDLNKELVWSQSGGDGFQVVYTGADAELPDLKKAVPDWEVSTETYMLWGRSSGSEAPDADVFLELQLPRILRYPVSCGRDKGRPVLKTIEYRDKTTGQIQHYRFHRLEEANEPL